LNRPEQNGAVLIVAVYGGGILLDVKTEMIIKSGEMTVDTITIPTDADTIKVMMWESFETLRPLCETGTVGWKGDKWE